MTIYFSHNHWQSNTIIHTHNNNHHVRLSDLNIAAEMGINIHMYEDDTQLYVHCKSSDTTDAAAKLERCIAVIDKWMAANQLKSPK